MAFPSTSWPTSVDTAETRADGSDIVYSADFEYQDTQIRTIQTWLGATGKLIGEDVAGAGPSGAVSPEADGGTAFTVAAREDFTSGTLLSVGDDFDSSYVEKFSVEYNGQAYVDGNRVLTEDSGEFASITPKGTPTTSDYLLIEDAAVTNTKKSITIGDLPAAAPAQHALGGSGHSSATLAELNALVSDATLDDASDNRTDATAVHDNVDGEIYAVSEKTSPAGTDVILIEDSAVSYAKKRVQITNLPGGGGGTDVRGANIVIGNAAAGDTSAVCDALDTGNGTLLKSTIEGASAGDLIFVRAGTYDLGSGPQTRISVPASVRVVGAGRYQTSIKAWTGADGRVLLLNLFSDVSDLYVEAPAPTVQSTAGAVIEGFTGNSIRLRRVRVFFTGTWPAAANVAITAGFKMTGSSLMYMSDCWFWGMPNGDSGAAQVHGLDLDGCDARISGLITQKGYDAIHAVDSEVQASRLRLQDYTHNGIYHSGTSVSGFRSGYSDGLFRGRAYTGITHDGIVLNTAAGTDLGVGLSNLYLCQSASASSGVHGYGISVTNADRNSIHNCRIFDYGADGSRLGAIHLDANTSNNIVLGNTLGGNSVVDLGSNNEVAHNI